MDLSEFSLLYPPMYDESTPLPDITEETVEQLELDLLFDLKNCSLSDFSQWHPEVIRYRQDVFDDMAEFPRSLRLSRALSRYCLTLASFAGLRLAPPSAPRKHNRTFSITEIELYTLCISILHDGFAPLADKVKSEAFKTLATRINELTESEYYRDLNEKLSALTQRVRDIKSITVGVNLDSQLRPVYAGVLSINSRPFKSGEVIDKILRLDFRRDDMTCIAPLTPFMKGQSENQQYATAHAFYSAINDVFRSSIHSWRRVIQMYVLENTDFLLRILPEIEFVVKASRVNAALKKRGVKLCRPEIRPASERVLQFYNLYNPVVALRIDDDIVKNDLIFDDDAMIYVLTGPNRGGKSVITCALGQAVAFAMLGMPVPADSAVISPADGIYTHFPTGSEDTIDKGRLGEECARLKEILTALRRIVLFYLTRLFINRRL